MSARSRTTTTSPRRWPHWPTSTSTTPSGPPTATTPPSRASPNISRRPGRLPHAQGNRVPGRRRGQPYATLRGDPGRRQGLRQDRRHREFGEKGGQGHHRRRDGDRKSTRLNSSHSQISYAVFCLKKKKTKREKSSTVRREKKGR